MLTPTWKEEPRKELRVEFVHLPPIHRLKARVEEIWTCLKLSAEHRIVIHKEKCGEGIISTIDDIDLRDMWIFLETKKVRPLV